jgi:superfamily II DNA or RNA helicase
MGNFAVTHNSYGMSGLCRAFPNARTVVIAPGVSLCKQIFDHLAETLPHRDVRGIYTGSKHKIQGPDITVCSMDSMDKMDTEDTDMLIVDECHAVVSEERLPKLAAFAKARKYGFGATLTGRFDKKDRLIEGLIGPVLTNVSYKEGVALGAVSPLKVMMVKIPFSKDTIPGNRVERDVVYKRLLHQSSKAAKLVKQLVDEIIPADWQTMAFISNEKQAEFYMQHAFPPHGTIAMAKRMKDKERDAITAQIASGELVRVLASNIYVQGITFPDLKVVINLAGGGANTTAIQKPGRLLQCRPGKNYGVMIDFIFECRDAETDNRQHPPYQGIVGESWARHKAYTEIGYDVVFVDRAEQAHDIMKGAYNE